MLLFYAIFVSKYYFFFILYLFISRHMYQNVVAEMPVERTAPYYKMDHPRRGLAVIFNHEVFNVHGLRARSGTQVDNECLKEQLTALGFYVKSFQNLNYSQLAEEVEKGVLN